MDTNLKCAVCGTDLYNTDQCFTEFSYHCSSSEARFWDFDRGSQDQVKAKEHWDQSKLEIPTQKKLKA